MLSFIKKAFIFGFRVPALRPLTLQQERLATRDQGRDSQDAHLSKLVLLPGTTTLFGVWLLIEAFDDPVALVLAFWPRLSSRLSLSRTVVRPLLF